VTRIAPDNLARWIVDPKDSTKKVAMPALGVQPDEARDIAAYLYTLH
jgi:cytochrome c